MKKTAKKLTALALSAALLTAPAGAITADGQSETWFDGVWSLIDAFSIKTEHDPYVLQNYINKYLEKHPEEMYDVINDILGLLDTHSMYLSSEEYSQGFSTLEGFVGIGVGLRQTAGGVQIGEVMRYSAAEEAGLQIGDLIVKIDGETARAGGHDGQRDRAPSGPRHHGHDHAPSGQSGLRLEQHADAGRRVYQDQLVRLGKRLAGVL